MEQQLSDSMKAILVKIALELKKFGWKSNSQTNEIDVFQGHLEMYKNTEWRGNGDLPSVSMDIYIDMSFAQNEQNGVYFLIFTETYSMNVDGAGGDERTENNDLSIDFSESDVNNIAKIQQAAKEINNEVVKNTNEHGYDYAEQSYQDWKQYRDSGEASADKYEPWKDIGY